MEFDFDVRTDWGTPTEEPEALELTQLSSGEVVHYEVINNQLMEEVDNGNS